MDTIVQIYDLPTYRNKSSDEPLIQSVCVLPGTYLNELLDCSIFPAAALAYFRLPKNPSYESLTQSIDNNKLINVMAILKNMPKMDFLYCDISFFAYSADTKIKIRQLFCSYEELNEYISMGRLMIATAINNIYDIEYATTENLRLYTITCSRKTRKPEVRVSSLNADREKLSKIFKDTAIQANRYINF